MNAMFMKDRMKKISIGLLRMAIGLDGYRHLFQMRVFSDKKLQVTSNVRGRGTSYNYISDNLQRGNNWLVSSLKLPLARRHLW